MKGLEPVLVTDLFPEDREQLLALLSSLSDAQWRAPTVCEGWSVKDVALHLLGVDIGVLSRKRDQHIAGAPENAGWDALVAFLNEWNEAWVRAARRISAPLLVSLLEVTGRQTHEYFRSLDLNAAGGPGPGAGVAGRSQGVHRKMASSAAHPRRGEPAGHDGATLRRSGSPDLRPDPAAYVPRSGGR